MLILLLFSGNSVIFYIVKFALYSEVINVIDVVFMEVKSLSFASSSPSSSSSLASASVVYWRVKEARSGIVVSECLRTPVCALDIVV